MQTVQIQCRFNEFKWLDWNGSLYAELTAREYLHRTWFAYKILHKSQSDTQLFLIENVEKCKCSLM